MESIAEMISRARKEHDEKRDDLWLAEANAEEVVDRGKLGDEYRIMATLDVGCTKMILKEHASSVQDIRREVDEEGGEEAEGRE